MLTKGMSPHAKGISTISGAALMAAHLMAKDFVGSSAWPTNELNF